MVCGACDGRLDGKESRLGRFDLADDPIIIYGAPRSGTTFLRALLSEHPDVFISNETRVFAWAHQTLHVTPNEQRYFLNYRDPFKRHLVPWMRFLIRDLYRDLGNGAPIWGDKYPHYCQSPVVLETILELFPGARFIQIIRDGRDVVASILRKGWADLERCHTLWLKHVQVGSDFGEALPDGRFYSLRYEDLIGDLERGAESLFDFVGVPLTENVRAFCRQEQQAPTEYSEPTRDITSMGVAHSDWAELLDPEQQRTSLEILAPALERLGYPVTIAAIAEREQLSRDS